MTEAVIVATARSPIGRASKGSLVDLRPDDMAAQIVTRADGQGAVGVGLGRRGPHHGLWAAGGRGGLQHRSHRRRVWPGSTTSPASRSTGTARPVCRRFAWPPTRSRRARATASSPQASRRSAATAAGRATRRRTRSSRSPGRRTKAAFAGRAAVVDATGGSARLLHRNGSDRRERRRAGERVARGHGPLGRAQPAARRRRAGAWILRRRDHPAHAARRHRRVEGRRPARRHHRGGPRRTEAGVPPRRQDHRRQRLPAERRCRRRAW